MEERTNVVTTKHYLERAKERTGLNERRARKVLQAAVERGITSENCKCSSDRRFLANRTTDNSKAIAYNGWCYILSEDMERCITVLPLPRDFGRKKRHYEIRKMSDPRYLRREAYAA